MPVNYTLQLSPTESAAIPDGDGYYLSHELFSAHDELSTLTVSMLIGGSFQHGEAPHTKRVDASETYTVHIGVTDPSEEAALDRVLVPYVDADDHIEIDDVSFTVDRLVRKQTSFETLYEEGQEYDDPEITVTYETPTCITHPHSTVTEMFPHRRGVFPHLAARWNEVTGEDSPTMAVDPFEVGATMFEKPRAGSYATYSTLTDIRGDDGDRTPYFRQGFTGTCSYGFREASPALQGDIATLATFAAFAGVGTATHHGCGSVTVNIHERGAGQ